MNNRERERSRIKFPLTWTSPTIRSSFLSALPARPAVPSTPRRASPIIDHLYLFLLPDFPSRSPSPVASSDPPSHTLAPLSAENKLLKKICYSDIARAARRKSQGARERSARGRSKGDEKIFFLVIGLLAPLRVNILI